MLIASALVLTTLTACVPSGSNRIELPALSGEYDRCFAAKVPQPNPGNMSKKQVVALIASLKKSETAKSQCGKRLIKFYEGLQKGLK
jgi:hypothetical protein